MNSMNIVLFQKLASLFEKFVFRNIDDVDKTMDEINEQTENMKQIQEALSAPIGAAADFDEVVNPLTCFLIFLGIAYISFIIY